MEPASFQRALAAQQAGHLPQAEQIYRDLLALQPEHVESLVNRGWVLAQLHRDGEALDSLGRALALRPDAVRALHLRACVLHRLQRFPEALLDCDAAIALQPGNAQLHFVRGNVLGELAEHTGALASYDRAIALQPDFTQALSNRGILKLLLGDFAGGWPDYEHRRPQDRSQRMLPGLQAPDWQGQDPDGLSILVSDATGMGDEIHFVRYLPLLAARGARVSFIGSARLYRLFAALGPSVQLLPGLPADATFDFQCKLLSLPGLFGTDAASIPVAVPYLQAEPALSEKWGQRIGDGGFRIGVCWKGNPSRTIDAGRSFPLAGLQALAALPGVRLISLQKRFGLEELETLPAGMQVETLGADFDEGSDAFVDSAAAMQHLDLVISSDTSLAHLAGALGRPGWLALKQVPEWRWQLDRDDCPWYPSLRLFRQRRRGEWEAVFESMASTLAKRLLSA